MLESELDELDEEVEGGVELDVLDEVVDAVEEVAGATDEVRVGVGLADVDGGVDDR